MAKKINTRLADIEAKVKAGEQLSDDEAWIYYKEVLLMNDEDINFMLSGLPVQSDPKSKVY